MSKPYINSRYPVTICLLGLLFFSIAAFAQEAPVRTDGTVEPEVLNLKIAEVEASTALNEQVKGTLLDLYRRALTNLEIARVEQSAADALAEAAANAPAEMESTRKSLEKLRNSTAGESLKISARMELSELQQALSNEKAALTDFVPQVTELREQYVREVARPGQAQERLGVARSERDAALEEINTQAPIGEAAELTEARRWRLETRVQKLAGEMRKLEQELLTRDVRFRLLEVNQEYASLKLERIRTRARMLEDAISTRRGAEAELARQDAETTQQKLETQHPSVKELAVKNVELGKQLTQRSEQIQMASDQRDATRRQLTQLAEELNSTRNKLAIAGVNQVLGQLLVDQRNALPNVRRMEREARDRERQVANVGLQLIELGEQRRELRDPDAYIDKLTRNIASGKAESVREELKPLAEARRELIEKSIDASSTYLSVLSELHLAQRQLTDAVRDYRKFLDSRLLWIRNSPSIDPSAFLSLPGDVKRLLSASHWDQALADFKSASRDKPLFVLALAFFLILGLLRSQFLARLEVNARYVGQVSKDRFSYTIRAIIDTALSSMPLAVVFILFGLIVAGNPESAAFSISLATVMMLVGSSLLYILFVLDACREYGLLRVHCGWSDLAVDKFSKAFRWFLLVFPAAHFVGELSFSLDGGARVGGLAVVGTVIAAASLSMLIFHLFTPSGGILSNYLRHRSGSLLEQTRPLWIAAITMVIPLLLILWLTGYHYTARELAESYMYSFWLLVLLMALHSLLIRWLMLGYQRLELKAAIERRDAARAARRAAKESPEDDRLIDEVGLDFEEPSVDFKTLSGNSRALLKTLMIFVAVFWLWLIWTPIFPALSILEDIALWTRSGTLNGELVQIPVTVADLLFALLVLVATGAAAKGVPALVQLVLLQRKSITAGSRYTVTTLLRYVIIGVGGITVVGMLGISWSKAQWLVAALGVGIGFGLQEIVANFISGLVILFERPIRVGDIVTVGDTSGVVTRIQIRATTIRDYDRRELLVPNKEFITGRLLNWSLSDDITRLLIPVGIAYGSDVMLAMKLAEEAAREHHEVLDDPAPFVIFEGFGDNALNIALRAYLPNMEHRLTTKSELNESINRKFVEAGITIAFPQRDVHLDTKRPLEIRMRPAED